MVGSSCRQKFIPEFVSRTEGGLHRTAPVQGAIAAMRRKGKRRAELTELCPGHSPLQQALMAILELGDTVGSLMLTRRRQSEIKHKLSSSLPSPSR